MARAPWLFGLVCPSARHRIGGDHESDSQLFINLIEEPPAVSAGAGLIGVLKAL